MRPAATSSRISAGVRCGSRSATRFISGVTIPSRACSSWVIGSKPSGAQIRTRSRARAPDARTRRGARRRAVRVQSSGMKSQAVLSEGCGMPGVSGEEKVRAPPTCGGFAKLPGVVPWSVEDGLLPRPGRPKRLASRARCSEAGLESADMAGLPYARDGRPAPRGRRPVRGKKAIRFEGSALRPSRRRGGRAPGPPPGLDFDRSRQVARRSSSGGPSVSRRRKA